MTKKDVLGLLFGLEDSSLTLADELNRIPFDGLIEINLRSKQVQDLFHVDNKYMGLEFSGDYLKVQEFVLSHFVNPEDAARYKAFLNMEDMAERLEASETKGIILGEFRLKGVDGSWIKARHLLIQGNQLDMPEWIVYCYLYDYSGVHKSQDRPVEVEEEGGGDYSGGMGFFRQAQERMDDFKYNYCIIDIDLEYYKQFLEWYGMESSRYLINHAKEIINQYAFINGGIADYLGQEKFCLITPYDMDSINDLHVMLQKLISSVSNIDGFSPIFGIALIDGTSDKILEYYNHAALTCDAMKGNIHSRISLYDAEFHKQNSQEYRLLYEFQNAIDNGEISFWLQPQYRVSNRKIVGAESLARWKHADGDWISPAIFVPILEKYGLVTGLDTYIWEKVCAWIRKRLDEHLPVVPISVNISQIDIQALNVPEIFASLIKKYDLPVSLVKLEITESAYVDNSEIVTKTVAELRRLGFMVMMDDFGSGYSSLNKLNSLSVDLIKLDARFLRLEDNKEQKGISILESVVNMTRNLSIPVIVEGVENENQVKLMSGLGCRYMQGFYFNRPMPVEQFEELTKTNSVIDDHGFIFKANEQVHVREFLDENIYSDSMLNNILGPVFFLNIKDKKIDIVRFNEQFFEMVNVELEDFNINRSNIQDQIHKEDREKMYEMIITAKTHKTIGAKGILRYIKPSGIMMWLSLQLYYINENEEGTKFYASAKDVTELQYLNSDLPGAYFRCTLRDGYRFLFISENFEKMTGYTEYEIDRIFDNKLINMIHPEDIEKVINKCEAIIVGEDTKIPPYRIRCKDDDYIYVAEQSIVTDNYGEVCWRSIFIDVSEVMRTKKQMQALSNCLTDTILSVHKTSKGLVYRPVIYKLDEEMGMDQFTFERILNSGEFCFYIEGHDEGIPHNVYMEKFLEETVEKHKILNINLPDGKHLKLLARTDKVDEPDSDIEYVVILRKEG
ncbi:MAG: EAL domain-containing protein [Lachnospiraceae bacterium]|nr:EAL domain-containing protein [Lachnospiraceae bacterium]